MLKLHVYGAPEVKTALLKVIDTSETWSKLVLNVLLHTLSTDMEITIRRLALIFLALCLIYSVHLSYNNSNECHSRSASQFKVIHVDKSFEILKHPVSIIGARNLVAQLRQPRSSFSIPPPLNLKFKNINFAPESMSPCSNGAENPIDLLILIKSGTGNHEKRSINRDTWANPLYLSKFSVSIKYGFVMGEPVPATNGTAANVKRETLISEASQYGDLILGDFMDTYANVTYKTMAGYKWAVEFCPHFKFYISLDDDTYISISNLIRYLQSPRDFIRSILKDVKAPPKFIPHDEHLFAGSAAKSLLPIRKSDKKWYLSPEDYPFSSLAPYHLGYFLLISRETVESFHCLSPYMKELSIDDVYLGEMAHELRIPLLDMGYAVTPSYNVNITLLSCEPNSKFSIQFIAVHAFRPIEERREIWKEMNCFNDLRNGWEAKDSLRGLLNAGNATHLQAQFNV